MTIGARSQTDRTGLEKHLSEYLNCSVEDLVRHGLFATPYPKKLNLHLRYIA